MNQLEHMINSMMAGVKADTDHTFDSYREELIALDRKLEATENLFHQALAAVAANRKRIRNSLEDPIPQAQLPPRRNPNPPPPAIAQLQRTNGEPKDGRAASQ